MKISKLVGLMLTASLSTSIVLMGCATTSRSGMDPALNSDLPKPSLDAVKELGSFRITGTEPQQVPDPELDAIPTEINEKVEQWVSYFQKRGRPHMERYLSRSSRYSTLMKKILRENGLPEDLIYIALIESGFNQKATSHAAAVGYWQFIRGTGKRYGLEINSLVDERRDPVLSTQAAAEYYKGLYSIFGSWYLAMASYNVGENRVKRETVKHKTVDFWELVRKKRLPKETMSYVPKYIAARLIGRDPAKYGFTEIDWQKPIEFELVKIETPVNLRIMAENMGILYEDLKLINPKFKGEIAPTKENGILELRVPLGQTTVAMAAAQKSIVDKIEFIADAGETKTYRVRRGDSLFTIAKRNRTTVSWLREVNDLGKGRKLRIGQRVQVPDRSRKPAPEKRSIVAAAAPKKLEPVLKETTSGSTNEVAKTEDVEQAAQDPEIVTAKGTYYVVQPGDSLYTIAREYESTVKELLKMNKMKRGRILKVGIKILVPKDEKLPEDPNEEPKRDVKAQETVPANPPTIEPDEASNQLNAQAKQPVAKVKESVLAGAAKLAKEPRSPAADGSKARVHVVKRGENLFRISKIYGVSMKSISETNALRRSGQLSTGKKLIIPE